MMESRTFTKAMRKAYSSPYEQDEFMRQPIVVKLLQAMRISDMKNVTRWATIVSQQPSVMNYLQRPTYPSDLSKFTGTPQEKHLKQIIVMADKLTSLHSHMTTLERFEKLAKTTTQSSRRTKATLRTQYEAILQECHNEIDSFLKQEETS